MFQHRGLGRGGGGGLGRTCGNSSETAQGRREREGGRGEREEKGGAGRDRSGEGLNSITSQLLLFGGVSSDHKP